MYMFHFYLHFSCTTALLAHTPQCHEIKTDTEILAKKFCLFLPQHEVFLTLVWSKSQDSNAELWANDGIRK